MKERIKKNVKDYLDDAFQIANYLYENPELGYQEVKACNALCDAFERSGFEVLKGIYNIPTAFKATYDSGKEGPTLALCAEYDALPDIGHGCGHNLICSMAFLAATALKPILPEIGGKVVVFGTPAEETSGAKVAMADQGAFDDVSIAMMAHPAPVSEESGSSLTLIPLQFQYYGKSAHAAACPEEGINALDSLIQLYNGINALRQHVPNDVQFHGYISNGGSAPNIVPDFAEARFYIRAKKRATAEAAVERVKHIAEGAALMTGARLEISSFEETYYDLVTNQALLEVFTANQKSLGDDVRPAQEGIGSLDLGNVSYKAPCVHGWIGFGDSSLIIHSREFAAKTVTEEGRDLLYRGACAMALTGYDVITDKELLSRIREEFESVK
ncbi:M20 family metallopeptidase [Anaerovorax sp. IOR16]|uniref:M20 family metallopeptidase n=1 Tax=Anaerovorax sp. IOR16 TaxID=2773458 RepID=UPI0019D01D1C|nr:M20 family metallopeptidase [Anaerovorax sp. IOR16]